MTQGIYGAWDLWRGGFMARGIYGAGASWREGFMTQGIYGAWAFHTVPPKFSNPTGKALSDILSGNFQESISPEQPATIQETKPAKDSQKFFLQSPKQIEREIKNFTFPFKFCENNLK